MADASEWKTKSVAMSGGVQLDVVPVLRDANAPGSLVDAQNFQSGKRGGYERIKGYTKFDSTTVPGTGRVLGSFVFNDGVLACRNAGIYFSTGSGWSADIAPTARTGATYFRAARYRWSSARIVLVDGVNYPVRFIGTSGTDLSAAPQGATCVWEHKNYLFFGKGGILTQSEPGSDTGYSGAGGAAVYNVGDTIVALRSWRDALYIFCNTSIHVLRGSSNTDFTLEPVTKDIGTTWPDTVQEVAGDIIFMAPDGLRTISGTSKINDVNLGTISNPILDLLSFNMSTVFDTLCAIVVDEEASYRLFWSNQNYTDANSFGVNACLIEDQGLTRYEFFPLKGINATTGDHGVINSTTQLVVHAAWDGYVYRQNYLDTFNGSNIPAYIKTPYFVFDDPAMRKTVYKVRLYTDVEGGAISQLTAQVSLDDGDSTTLQPGSIDMTVNVPPEVAVYGWSGGSFGGSLYGTAVYGRQNSSNYKAGVIGSGYNISFTFSSNDILPAYTIRTIIIEYSMDSRQ